MTVQLTIRNGRGVVLWDGEAEDPSFHVEVNGKPAVGVLPDTGSEYAVGHWPDGGAWTPLAPFALPTADEVAVDLGLVVQILHDEHGVYCHLEHTGGGVSTIFAGRTRNRGDGSVQRAAVAGPGNLIDGGTAYLAEFYVGPDLPDGGPVVDAWKAGCRDAADVARLIALQAQMPFGECVPPRQLAWHRFNPAGYLSPEPAKS